jgi:adenosylcobinamide-phosphate synthase
MAIMPLLNLAIALAALLIEAIAGYPLPLFRLVGHPVTWIGALIAALDRWLNRDADSFERRRILGGVALATVLLAAAGAGVFIQGLALLTLPRALAVFALAVLASSCLAQRSLDDHVRAACEALRASGLEAGRRAVSMIVGRDTAGLDEAGIARAAIESLAENFSDGIVAPSLYIALGGLPGGLFYKAVNTSDSMIGHRMPRYAAFGFAAAKLDDLVNWPAARLAALAIILAAALTPGTSPAQAWRIMWRDARGHPSPNAGWPEAAMAGALGIRLGGSRSYGGHIVEDAAMGDGAEARVADIARALQLYRLACGLNWVFVLIALCVIARA